MSNIISIKAPHSHNPNETENIASCLVNKMRKRCREELTSIPRINLTKSLICTYFDTHAVNIVMPLLQTCQIEKYSTIIVRRTFVPKQPATAK